MKVIKRNGDMVDYNYDKIYSAISRAMIDTYGNDEKATDYANEVHEIIQKCNKDMSVENIQDLVEETICAYDYELAKEYIRYRYKKEVSRGMSADFLEGIKTKLEAKDVQNQNANVDENSFGGRLGEAASYMTKNYALNYLMSKTAKENHENNLIYTHDLDSYALGSHNCLSIPFDDLLANGFNTRQTDVRPANSISTAFQLLAVIFQLQSLQQFGGTSATHLDWTMIPYVRKSFYKHYKDGVKYIDILELDYSFHPELPIDDEEYKIYSPMAYKYAMDMTIKELNQAVEGMFHNLK